MSRGVEDERTAKHELSTRRSGPGRVESKVIPMRKVSQWCSHRKTCHTKKQSEPSDGFVFEYTRPPDEPEVAAG